MILKILCVTFLAAGIAPNALAEGPSDLSLVLLIGQSNMAGRGKVEAGDRQPIPGVFMLNADGQWVPAIDPMHWDKAQAGVGLGREFARVLVDARPGSRIGLIPAAVGGTSISRWRPGKELYNDALERLRIAQKSGKLAAILWHQGESEAGSVERSAAYGENWIAMMEQLRKDAGAPDVPIIAGELGEYLYTRSGGKSPHARVVNKQIMSLPDRMTNVAAVPSKGLTHRGDELHFDADSLREFGRRYAKAFLKLSPEWQIAPASP
jgi:hypothetical protein